MSSTETSPRPRRRWITILLIVSLGLNMILVGFLVGSVLRSHPHRDPVISVWAIRKALRDLPSDERERVRDAFEQVRAEMRSRAGDMGVLRDTLGQTLTADPFDAQAFADALDALEDQRTAVADIGKRKLVEIVATFDLPIRQRLMEAMKRQRRARKH